MTEFVCNEDLLINFFNKLIEKTEERKISWYRKDSNLYYTKNLPSLSIRICNLEVIICIDKDGIPKYKKITISSSLWPYVVKLSSLIKENNKSVETLINSMIIDLEKLK